jgi:hypothetical protein
MGVIGFKEGTGCGLPPDGLHEGGALAGEQGLTFGF